MLCTYSVREELACSFKMDFTHHPYKFTGTWFGWEGDRATLPIIREYNCLCYRNPLLTNQYTLMGWHSFVAPFGSSIVEWNARENIFVPQKLLCVFWSQKSGCNTWISPELRCGSHCAKSWNARKWIWISCIRDAWSSLIYGQDVVFLYVLFPLFFFSVDFFPQRKNI